MLQRVQAQNADAQRRVQLGGGDSSHAHPRPLHRPHSTHSLLRGRLKTPVAECSRWLHETRCRSGSPLRISPSRGARRRILAHTIPRTPTYRTSSAPAWESEIPLCRRSSSQAQVALPYLRRRRELSERDGHRGSSGFLRLTATKGALRSRRLPSPAQLAAEWEETAYDQGVPNRRIVAIARRAIDLCNVL